MDRIYTIGHSNHGIEKFLALLEQHGIETVVDVRSQPYSRFNPHFKYRALGQALEGAGLGYVFAGDGLGARPGDPACYKEGCVNFDLLARRPGCQEALARVRNAARGSRVCLMCAEKEPIACHRTLLVCRHMKDPELQIRHILADGSLEDHRDLEIRMMRRQGMDQAHLFEKDPAARLEKAYDLAIAAMQRRR